MAGFITYSSSGKDACVERSCAVSERYVSDYKDEICQWTNFLFNITADPEEKVNLYYEDDYQVRRRRTGGASEGAIERRWRARSSERAGHLTPYS